MTKEEVQQQPPETAGSVTEVQQNNEDIPGSSWFPSLVAAGAQAMQSGVIALTGNGEESPV